jgi:ABC-type sulfate/molybdate transport systems ATPase subunit
VSELRIDARIERGEFAVDVKLDVADGVTALVGPSGAGKSSTLMLVAGLVRPQRGSVSLDGATWCDEHSSLPPESRGVGWVPQSLALFPHLDARANVAFGAALPGDADTMLQRFGAAHLADRMPRTFSGGEAQRVALARALARRPSVLLLDEPFAALDDALKRTLWDELRAVLAERPMPAILVTHDETEAASFCVPERIVRLDMRPKGP